MWGDEETLGLWTGHRVYVSLEVLLDQLRLVWIKEGVEYM